MSEDEEEVQFYTDETYRMRVAMAVLAGIVILGLMSIPIIIAFSG
jgi:hypothetical protein